MERKDCDRNRQRLEHSQRFPIRNDFIDQCEEAQYRAEVVKEDEHVSAPERIIPETRLEYSHVP